MRNKYTCKCLVYLYKYPLIFHISTTLCCTKSFFFLDYKYNICFPEWNFFLRKIIMIFKTFWIFQNILLEMGKQLVLSCNLYRKMFFLSMFNFSFCYIFFKERSKLKLAFSVFHFNLSKKNGTFYNFYKHVGRFLNLQL